MGLDLVFRMDRCDAATQVLEYRFIAQAGKLATETVQVPKHSLVDDADQAEKL
jgi:hypothetical protein